MPAPDLTIVIPYYNRADTIRDTLESIEQARRQWQVETILVDDGSLIPAEQTLSAQDRKRVSRIIRQENQGLLFARLTGLAAATGEYVLFLDSDDLVGPEKFDAQLTPMRHASVDVSYTDSADIDLSQPAAERSPRPHQPTETTTDPADFYIRIQPPPHSPIFRRAYLQAILHHPVVPPSPRYNPIAEVWFYFNAALHSGRVLKVPGAHTWIGHHPGPRITGHWERMGFASTALTTAFMRNCPIDPSTRSARQILGGCIFHRWRALPYDFPAPLQNHLIALWRRAPAPAQATHGGRGFRLLARLLGPVTAGRILRRWHGHNYASCRTVEDAELRDMITRLPSL